MNVTIVVRGIVGASGLRARRRLTRGRHDEGGGRGGEAACATAPPPARRCAVRFWAWIGSSTSTEAPHRPRSLHQRLTPAEVEALVAAYRAGVRQPVLAERYGIGVTSVKKLIRQARACE